MPEKQNFLITVFSTVKTETARLALAQRTLDNLRTVCPGQVQLVHPDKTKLVLLAQGEVGAIVKALQAACQQEDDPWLLAQVGMPCAASGLGPADGWLRSRSQASGK